MKKPLNKRKLFKYIIVNLTISSLIIFILWYTGRFIEGILFYIGLVLDLPAFIIIAFIEGTNNAMHFTSENIYRVVSFIFYSFLIALIQLFIHKRRNK